MSENNSDKQTEQDIVALNQYIQEKEERLRFKLDLRQKNQNVESLRLDDGVLKRLDSSIKKVTSFIKKLKTLTESQKDSLNKDMAQLNLSKYLSEVAAAFLEAKLKMNDVHCALVLCSQMHQSYADFSSIFFEQWQKSLAVNKKDTKIQNPSKLRVDLRFFADLISIGVLPEKEALSLLGNQLTLLTTCDKEHLNISIVCSFCKHCGEDFADLVPLRHESVSLKHDIQIPRNTLYSNDRQRAVKCLFKEYFASVSKHLIAEHKELHRIESQNIKIYQSKGELHTDKREKYEQALNAFKKLTENSQVLADLLGEQMPDLPKEDNGKREDGMLNIDVYTPMRSDEFDSNSSPWEDEETRQFYESLPEIKSLMPEILYKDSAKTPVAVVEAKNETDPSVQQSKDQEQDKEKEKDMVDMSIEIEKIEKEIEEIESENLAVTCEEEPSELMDEEQDEPVVKAESQTQDKSVSNANMKALMDSFINQLPNCVNRELIDKAAKDYCLNLNTKVNRKRLTRALFEVQRTRLDLLPFYARLVATLNPVMPEIATDLANLLLNDFRYQVRKKDQINIESKIKVSRFIGEMVKFNMLAKVDALNCLKTLLADFRHHNIEMFCNLVEVCGRYLYRNADTHIKMNLLLEILMRKKQTAMSMDNRYTIMIENAFYYCNPPDNKQTEKKPLCPIEEYVKKILYKELNKLCVEKMLRQMRKLNWHDENVRSKAISCLTSAWNVRYNSIHCLANLVSGLALYYQDIGIEIVDAVIEDIRLGLELNLPKYNQRRVSMLKYLGELYNYRMVDSSIIFKTLYTLITFGVSYEPNELATLADSCPDPLHNYFRIRLVCTLLDTCGQYFDRGSTKKKLDCYLNYFQRYYMFKRDHAHLSMSSVERPFDSIDIEFVFTDIVGTLRPDFKFAKSYEQACQQVNKMEAEIRDSLSKSNPTLVSQLSVNETDSLPTISEYDGQEDECEEEEQDEDVDVEYRCGGEEDGEDFDDDDNDDDDDQGDIGRKGRHYDDDEEGYQEERCHDNEQHQNTNNNNNSDTGSASEADESRIRIVQPKKETVCKEDDEFMKAFDFMVTENIAQRTKEAIKMPTVDISVPMLARKVNKSASQSHEVHELSTLTNVAKKELEPEVKKEAFNFVLMLKKGNKTQYQNMQVPITSEFATQFKAKEQLEKAEKEKLKQLTLNINERIEQEEFQEMVQQSNQKLNQSVMFAGNTNRDRFKYNHPKGAPDADQIFGSGSSSSGGCGGGGGQRNTRGYNK